EWSPGRAGVLDFVDIYLRALLADTTSILFTEVANNQNIGAERYSIPSSNKLLTFFLADPKVGKQFYVYKSMGDSALSDLDQVGREPSGDPYNKTMEDFWEVGAWRSPLFVAIRFFDIMVREALFQDFDWHMWLYYFPLMMKKMVRNYRLIDPFVDPT